MSEIKVLLSSFSPLLPHFLLHEEMQDRNNHPGGNRLSSFEVADFSQALRGILSISFKKAILYAKVAFRWGLLGPFL